MTVGKIIFAATQQAIQKRLTKVRAIKKKYGLDINALRAIPITAQRKLQRLHQEIELLRSGGLAIDMLDALTPMLETSFKVKKGASKGGKSRAVRSMTKEKWQKEADHLFKKNPKLSKAKTAQIIATKFGGNANSIRQFIEKPTKNS